MKVLTYINYLHEMLLSEVADVMILAQGPDAVVWYLEQGIVEKHWSDAKDAGVRNGLIAVVDLGHDSDLPPAAYNEFIAKGIVAHVKGELLVEPL